MPLKAPECLLGRKAMASGVGRRAGHAAGACVSKSDANGTNRALSPPGGNKT